MILPAKIQKASRMTRLFIQNPATTFSLKPLPPLLTFQNADTKLEQPAG